MTVRQQILKLIYPLIKKLSAKNKNPDRQISPPGINPTISFYSLNATLTNKSAFNFSMLKGKKVMLVNLASNCGFTPQYEELEKLGQIYKSNLVILGFPANDFKGQEPGSDEEIENFCRINYNVTFPIFTKASVIKPGQQKVFEWLTDKNKNGWNDNQPSWNFCKYLVNEEGQLMATFEPYLSPLNVSVLKMIEEPVPLISQQPFINENERPLVR